MEHGENGCRCIKPVAGTYFFFFACKNRNAGVAVLVARAFLSNTFFAVSACKNCNARAALSAGSMPGAGMPAIVTFLSNTSLTVFVFWIANIETRGQQLQRCQ